MPKKKDYNDYPGKGRPTLYTPELADEICEAIASNKEGLTSLCNARAHWPHPSNIFIWLRRYSDFREKYAQAKAEQVEVSINYMQEMMEEPHLFVDDNGNKRVDVPMLRVKIDAIKWKASKLQAKKYGDNKQDEIKTDLLDESLKRKHELDEKNRKEF